MSSERKVVIIGASGFGREVIEIFKDANKLERRWDILGFIDDSKEMWGREINGFRVLGGTDWLAENRDMGIGCVVAIGEPKTKRKVVERLRGTGVSFVNAIHPSVIMSEFVELGEGVVICAGCILTVNIKIGDHVILNINSTVGHDTIIEDYCSAMPCVKINGNNHLHQGVYVGTGTSFIQQITVGQWTTIGAGSVVVKDIPEKVLALGVPAKPVKPLE